MNTYAKYFLLSAREDAATVVPLASRCCRSPTDCVPIRQAINVEGRALLRHGTHTSPWLLVEMPAVDEKYTSRLEGPLGETQRGREDNVQLRFASLVI